MSEDTPQSFTPAWPALRSRTPARIGLGRSGAALATREVLDFERAHALARDAVHAALDVDALAAQLRAEGWNTLGARSRAASRAAYLLRPDWGRRLHGDCVATLDHARGDSAPDLVIVLSDGLSATALQRHAAPLLAALRPLLNGLTLAPLVTATQARVALADEIGERLGARTALSLIGERPGLSAPDSLGAYLTFGPRVGCSDAERNCVSNIRPEGLAYAAAAAQLGALIRASLHAGCSGVALRFDPRAIATV